MKKTVVAVLALASMGAACASTGTRPGAVADLAIRNVTVVDPETGAALAGRTVMVDDGRIVSVAAGAGGRAAASVDGQGKYLVPGFWDAHAHISYGGSCALPLLVAHGVTSVRDLGGVPERLVDWRAAMAEGRLTGPTVKLAGHNVESEAWLTRVTQLLASQEDLKHYHPFEESPRIPVASPEQARAAVDRLHAMGVDVVKFRNLGGENFKAFVARARERNLPVAGHSASGLSLAEAVEAGQGSIEHGETVSNRLEKATEQERDALFARVAAAGGMITPTLIADYVRATPEAEQLRAIEQPDPHLSAPLLTMWRFGYDSRRFNGDRDWPVFFRKSAEDLKAAHRAGVPFMVGTDLGVLTIVPGVSVHREMAMMVEHLGLTPAEALKAATLNPARFFDPKAGGLMSPGAAADLVLLDSNPLTEIGATRSIRAVVLRGKLLDRAALDATLENVRAAVKAGKECVTP